MPIGANLPQYDASRALAAQLMRMKQDDRSRLKKEQQFAIDYLKNRQVSDVENELLLRFQQSQIGGSGQEIQPAVIPLTERYVAEIATLYNKPVKRYFVDSTGQETDRTKRLSEILVKSLDEIGYNSILQANDRLRVVLKMSCVWFQIHKGVLRPTIVYPYSVFPVAPEIAVEFDKSDPEDYGAFVIETDYDSEDPYSSRGMIYTMLTDTDRVTYRGNGPNAPTEVIDQSPHGFSSNPLTFWHESHDCDELITYSDCLIARANRELNVAWSVLLDVLRFQSYSTPVKKLVNPTQANAFQSHGVRFPVVLQAGVEEDFSYASSSTPYQETANVLREFAQLLAVAMRQNPEDFSTAGAQAVSGFSKMVSNLPKMEARDERISQTKRIEEHVAAPLVIDALVSSGNLPEEAKSLKMRVEFSDIEYPQTPAEEAQSVATDIQYGFSTPAKILASKKGISIEEAEAQIEENLARNKELGIGQKTQPQQNQAQSISDIISGRARRNV